VTSSGKSGEFKETAALKGGGNPEPSLAKGSDIRSSQKGAET
jgi:hypothetical protein